VNNLFSRIPAPVKRAGAARYLRFSLLSFAATVILVRLFLALTGYPQLGNGTLHIAHVLWGGLLLFIASLLPLILANRWAYAVSGGLSGMGVGLFIDEVGKFITRNNDYFYPPAAPIIYGFFLLTVLLYFEVRRPPASDARTELYHALDGLEEVLDHDLSTHERAEVEGQLARVTQRSADPELVQLASVLLTFVRSASVTATRDVAGFWERLWQRLENWQERHVGQRPFRYLLVAGLAVLGLAALFNLLQWVVTAFFKTSLGPLSGLLVLGGVSASTGGVAWLVVRVILEWMVGVGLLNAARLFLIGQDWRGCRFAYYGLLLSLMTVNLLVFYFDQFRAVFSTLAQFALLLASLYYRQRYLTPAPGKEPAPAGSRQEERLAL
jgi:hypothetical protein